MWAALRSDLQEFVTTVSAEGANTLSVLDEKLTSMDKDDVESDEEGEVQSAAVLDGEVFGEGFESTGIISNAADELAHRRTLEETYLEKLPDTEDVKQFLETLNLSDEETTAEISLILQSYPNTVNQYFTDLVPTEVSYEDFWSRYFYRCNEERIEVEWEEERAERARARKAAAEALMNNAKQGWNIARHLVGDAAKALIGDTSNRNIGSEDDKHNSSAKAIAQAGLHWGSRPPFVLQSNEDSDEEEDDEEEELGWDDDDEEDIEVDEVDNEGEISGNETADSEEIVFHREQIQSQYVATQEEMDQLHQTIEMQRVEIERFKVLLESASPNEANTDSASSDVEQLRLTIFEKDTELAALRSKLQDTDEDDHDEEEGSDFPQTVTKKQYLELKNEVKSLQDALAEKNEEVLVLKEETAKLLETEAKDSSTEKILQLKSEIERMTKNSYSPSDEGDSSAFVLSLQSKLEEKDTLIAQADQYRLEQCAQYESKISSLNEELTVANSSLQNALETISSQKSLLDESHGSVAQLQDALASTKAENKVLQDEIAALKTRIHCLTEDLALAHDAVREQEALFSKRLQAELDHRKGESPESSLSSAVNVDSNMLGSPPQSLGCQPLPDVSATELKLTAKPPSTGEGQDEDDWGDAWGDELDVEED